MWNDTTTEPESIIGGPPYLKDRNDACANEPRSGTTITGSISTDGSTWTTVGTTTLTATSYAGLVVTSHDTSQQNTATFDSAAVSTSVP